MSLRTRLLLALGYLVALVTIAFAVPLTLNLRDRVGDEVRSQARNQTDVLAASASGLVARREAGDLRTLARRSAEAARGRVVFFDRAGRVLADSGSNATRGAVYANRPEVARALDGDRVQDTRDSETLGQRIQATSAPVFEGGRVVGAVRLTQSVDAVDDALNDTVRGIIAVGLVVLIAALFVAFLLSRGITGPIRRLRVAAEQVAAGDLDARAPVEGGAEQQSLARSFNTMTDRVARTVRAQREFVADASHQLRTPLTGLRLRLEEARAVSSQPEVGEEVDAALREVDRMSLMVDELLVLSRTGERDLPGEEVDTGEVVRDALDRWMGTAAEAGVSLEGSAEGVHVWCARRDLDRALDSVVENALVYTPAGGTVVVRARGPVIEVLDDGPGLGPGEEEDVFARFHRGRAGRAGAAGTGLGLPIARELMRCWDGEATLATRPEGGTVATLTLPAGVPA